jgi:hypothetical protein
MVSGLSARYVAPLKRASSCLGRAHAWDVLCLGVIAAHEDGDTISNPRRSQDQARCKCRFMCCWKRYSRASVEYPVCLIDQEPVLCVTSRVVMNLGGPGTGIWWSLT